jgi:hypothetical protein
MRDGLARQIDVATSKVSDPRDVVRAVDVLTDLSVV